MPDPSWFQIARNEIGVREISGPANHPRILSYHESTNLNRRAAGLETTPWCSSFCNYCLEQAGYIGTDSAVAKSWVSWGMELPEPWLGCITVVKKRDDGPDGATGSASGWHVAFWAGLNRLLGGNQANRVKYSHFGLDRYDYMGFRWPVHRRA
jgi:uncharacterized protein (TIGR02594 family)